MKHENIKYFYKKIDDLDDYQFIPMIASNKSIYQIKHIDHGLGGISLIEALVEPYQHDPSSNKGPNDWKSMFDIKNWGFYVAYDKKKPVAAITLAYQTEGCNMLKGRDDLVVIWDIRVQPSYQGQGIGKKLMALAYAWAKQRQARELKVETQNNNVNACKFYQSMGFHLGTIDLYAYGNKEDDEIMLLWYKKIT